MSLGPLGTFSVSKDHTWPEMGPGAAKATTHTGCRKILGMGLNWDSQFPRPR